MAGMPGMSDTSGDMPGMDMPAGPAEPKMLLFDGNNALAGQWYYIALVLLVVAQSVPRLIRRGSAFLPFLNRTHQRRQGKVNPVVLTVHRATYFHLPTYPYYPTRLVLFLAAYITLSALFATGTIRLDSDVGYPRYGYMALSNLCVAVIFALRNSPVYYIFALPFERTVEFHKWFGVGALFFAWMHGGLYLSQWTKEGMADFEFTYQPRMKFGPAVASCVTLLAIFAVGPVRRFCRELFYVVHVVAFLGAFVLVNFHTTYAFNYTMPPLALWALDRVTRFVKGWMRPVTVHAVPDANGEVTRLEVTQKQFWGKAYEAGQYVYLNVPKAGLMEWHPASIVSGAQRPGSGGGSSSTLENGSAAGLTTSSDHPSYTLVLRNVGNFTRKLVEHATTNPNLTAHVDGPYGAWDITADAYGLVVLIAGGIGATPMISVLTTVLQSARSSDQHVEFIWTVSDEDHVEWFREELERACSLGARVRIFVTRGDMVLKCNGTKEDVTVVEKGGERKEGQRIEIVHSKPRIEMLCKEIKEEYKDLDAAIGGKTHPQDPLSLLERVADPGSPS
ncbi:hypothetical protein HKX48_003126 [Thoreauomyces humboldtii]|nr:hypothetical protein HKX48_003126 [Thoreauomyces humboldtii]